MQWEESTDPSTRSSFRCSGDAPCHWSRTRSNRFFFSFLFLIPTNHPMRESYSWNESKPPANPQKVWLLHQEWSRKFGIWSNWETVSAPRSPCPLQRPTNPVKKLTGEKLVTKMAKPEDRPLRNRRVQTKAHLVPKATRWVYIKYSNVGHRKSKRWTAKSANHEMTRTYCAHPKAFSCKSSSLVNKFVIRVDVVTLCSVSRINIFSRSVLHLLWHTH